jgi:D-aminoacyl-tRNA deacylase
MRAVVQRVSSASAQVGSETVGSIETGLLVLVGVAKGDSTAEAKWLAGKIARLRVFPDADGAMNLDVAAAGGSVLVVSQFTLLADASRGNRPSFINAADPEIARGLCDEVASSLRSLDLRVETGRFREHMQVQLVNDGPVTIILEKTNPDNSQDVRP